MEAKIFCKALFPATFFFGLVARKPQHIRKEKHWKTKQKMAFEVFICIGMFRGRKEAFALSLTLGLGWSLESTNFLTHILRKRKKNLCVIPRQGVLVLSLIFRKENMAKFKRDTRMKRRKYEQVRKAQLYSILF